MSVDATHLNPDAEMGAQSEPSHSERHPINAGMPSGSVEEPHVEFLPDELSNASGEEIDKKPANESRKRRKRGARMRYTDEEITQMRLHLQEQMELSPRPPLLEVWTGYAAKHPGRTPSALMQEHGRHPELFGPRNLDHSFDCKGETPVATDTRYPDPLPPWTEEDTEVLVEFLRHRMEVGSAEWDQLHGKSQRRPPQSFRIKYFKNRQLYDSMAGRSPTTQPQTEDKTQIAEPNPPSFTWQLPAGNFKRPRSPEDVETSVSRRRRASNSLSKRYVDESSDENDSEDDYQEGKQHLTSATARRPRGRRSVTNNQTASPAITSPASASKTGPSLPARASVPISPDIATTSVLPSWLPEFTAADKAAALRWVITRQRPVDFFHNLRSWLEFADMHPEHSPPEWLCYYLFHYPTFDAVEAGLGSPVV